MGTQKKQLEFRLGKKKKKQGGLLMSHLPTVSELSADSRASISARWDIRNCTMNPPIVVRSTRIDAYVEG
jgi:hypothetical protein